MTRFRFVTGTACPMRFAISSGLACLTRRRYSAFCSTM